MLTTAMLLRTIHVRVMGTVLVGSIVIAPRSIGMTMRHVATISR